MQQSRESVVEESLEWMVQRAGFGASLFEYYLRSVSKFHRSSRYRIKSRCALEMIWERTPSSGAAMGPRQLFHK